MASYRHPQGDIKKVQLLSVSKRPMMVELS